MFLHGYYIQKYKYIFMYIQPGYNTLGLKWWKKRIENIYYIGTEQPNKKKTVFEVYLYCIVFD